MNEKVYFYKGTHKVKVVTKSEGYWLVEALEDFVDYVDDERVTINAGQRRLVPPDILDSQINSSAMQKPEFERKMGKRNVQGMVENAQDKQKAAELAGKTC